MSLEALAYWRHPLATLATAILATLFALRLLAPAPAEAPADNIVMHVSLTAPPAPPKIVEPTPPAPPKPQPQKEVQHTATRSPVVNNPKMPEAAADSTPKPTTQEAQTPPAPPAPVSPPAPPQVNNASLEAGYEARCLEQVEHVKRYPMSKDARLLRPEGTVTVVFVLNREGTLQSQEVETSAGSILDEQAQSTVRRAQCGTFPQGAWPKESQHRFRVKINFTPS